MDAPAVLEVTPEAYEALIDQARASKPSRATRNGAAPLPPVMPLLPADGPREEREVHWLTLPGLHEDGMQMRLWFNFPQRLLTEIDSGDAVRAEAALRRIVLEHNGWHDADGEPYPAADAPDFWAALSNVLATRAITMVRAVAQSHPNLMRPTRPR